MRKWCGLASVCLLFVVTACGGNSAAVTLSTVPPSAVPSEAARPTGTLVILSPTSIVTVQTATTEIPLPATGTAQPSSTLEIPLPVTKTAPPPSTALSTAIVPGANATSAAPTAAPLPADTPTIPSPTGQHGDAANGEILFAKMGCKGCHMPPPGSKRIAPDLKHILADAEQFIHLPEYQGTATDAPSYIRESIVLPNIFVVPAFRYLTPDGSTIMPRYFAERLSPAEIDDLVAYVLTLP